MLLTPKFIFSGWIHISNCLTGLSTVLFKRLCKPTKSKTKLLVFTQHTGPFPVFLGSVNGTPLTKSFEPVFPSGPTSILLGSLLHLFLNMNISQSASSFLHIYCDTVITLVQVTIIPYLTPTVKVSPFLLLFPSNPVSTTATTDLPSVNVRSCHPSA